LARLSCRCLPLIAVAMKESEAKPRQNDTLFSQSFSLVKSERAQFPQKLFASLLVAFGKMKPPTSKGVSILAQYLFRFGAPRFRQAYSATFLSRPNYPESLSHCCTQEPPMAALVATMCRSYLTETTPEAVCCNEFVHRFQSVTLGDNLHVDGPFDTKGLARKRLLTVLLTVEEFMGKSTAINHTHPER